MSNFQFLESHWTDLAKLGDLSEKYVYSDPNTSIIKQGMLSEVMVKYMLAYDGIAEPAYDNTHANRIRILKNNDLLPREIDNTLYILRKARNDAAHNAADEGEKALNNLQLMYELCVWYMQTYGDYNYEPTGIDVEEIVNLVFMRRIRSRILFEQMLGRATRLCPEIGKTHFEIYDAVGVYNALEPVSTMKPVVANPATTFDDLIDGIDSLDTDRARANQIDLIVAKMRRNKSQMSDEYRTQFEQITGGLTPEKFIEKIHSMPVDEAIETVKNNRAALEYVRRMPKEREKFISDEPDELRSHTRGYGDATRPEDYLKEFRDFIDNNMNEIAALNIVATRPKELTRQSLKELKIILDGKHFNETMLQTAWKEMTNEDIAADIISFIRQRSIGDALISKDDRIHNAIVKTKANHPELSKIQLGWLDRIEAQLLKEVVLNRETFDSDAFKNKGGYNAVNKAFGQKLDEFIDEINGYMYSA